MKDQRYAYFYLIGRQEDGDELDLGEYANVTELARSLLGKHAWQLRDFIHAQCVRDLARASEIESSGWCRDNHDVILEAGGDAEAAWGLFLRGRIDRMAANLEHEVMGQMRYLLEDAEELGEYESGDSDEGAGEEGDDGCDDEEDEAPADEEEDGAEDPFFGVFPIGRNAR